MSEETLYLVQIHPGLDDPRGKRMAKIMEMEILNLCYPQCGVQSMPNVAAIKSCIRLAVEHQLGHP
jgi:hypothetical protein